MTASISVALADAMSQMGRSLTPAAPYAQQTGKGAYLGAIYNFLVKDKKTKPAKWAAIILMEEYTFTKHYYNAANQVCGLVGPTTDGGYANYSGTDDKGNYPDDPVAIGTFADLNAYADFFLTAPHPNAAAAGVTDFRLTWMDLIYSEHDYWLQDSWVNTEYLYTITQGVYGTWTWNGNTSTSHFSSAY